MADMFNPKEIHYRFYAGDGNETNSTAKENEDTNHVLTVDTDQLIQVRMAIEAQNAEDGSTMDDYTILYEKNGTGGDIDVPTSDGGAGISTDLAGLTNETATVERVTDGLTAGAGSFVAGEQSSDGQVTDMQLTGSNYTEHVWGIKLYAANVADGNTFDFDFRCTNAATSAHSQMRITIDKTAPSGRVMSSLVGSGGLVGPGGIAGSGGGLVG